MDKMRETEVVIGTYENIILGFHIIKSLKKEGNPYSLETSFTDDAHRGALRCMSVSANGILASSSTDDSVRLHSLRRRKEIGGLFEHNGTVNFITFHDRSLMFTASDDRTICMWKTKNWEMLKTLKGHKAQVNCLAVHPSGKLAFSVGSDKSLLTWDLVTGKLAFQRKIKEAAQSIFFTPTGDYYILVYSRSAEVCAVEDTKVVQDLEMTWRINAFCHIQDAMYAVGGDDRHVFVLNVLSGDKVLTLDMAKPGQDTFTGRVRSICAVPSGEEGGSTVFVATSNGDIKAFNVCVTEGEESSEEVLWYSSSVRLTCMAVYSPSAASLENEHKKQASAKTTVENADSDVEEGDDDDGEDDHDEDNIDDDDHQKDEQDSDEVVKDTPSAKKKKKVKTANMEGKDIERKKRRKSPDVRASKKKKIKMH